MADTDKLPPVATTPEEREAFVAEVQQAKLEQQVEEQRQMTEASTPPTPPGTPVAAKKGAVKKKELADGTPAG